jgi:hypothetical protein
MHALLAIPGGLLTALPLAAEPPMLRPPTAILANGTGIDMGDYAIPCVADWNGDGCNDLLVGFRYGDKVAVFLNSGSPTAPVFGTSSLVRANGADINVPGSSCGAPAPWVCDYNADGLCDLLVGDGSNGTIHFYRNTHTNAQPLLAADAPLRMGAEPISVSSRATPTVADWDADGLKDLLCGDGNGYVSFFKNVGTAQVPAYAARVLLQASGANLNLGSRSVPRVSDWDGDGLQDLVGSSSTGVYWCRNTGSRAVPVLQAREALRVPTAAGSLTPIQTGTRMRLDLADWDGDGTPDLILGNTDGTLIRFAGYHFRVTSIQQPAEGALTLEWTSAPWLQYTILAGPSPDQINTPLISGLASGGDLTTWTCPISSPTQFYRIQVGP